MARITLNPEFEDGLRAKLAEYQERLQDQKEANSHAAPELVGLSTRAKIEATKALLESPDGIDTAELALKLNAKYGSEAGNKALDVVTGYNRNGGKSLFAGTGLKKPEKKKPVAALVKTGSFTEALAAQGKPEAMSQEEFQQRYNIDNYAHGEDKFATFDYQGMVHTRDGDVIFKDVMATNGLLKSDGNDGIHVGTDGIVGYSALSENHRMKGPQDVGEYDMYIKIPAAIQQATNSYTQYDQCFAASEFDGTPQELREMRENENYVVIRTNLNPHEDSLARQKMRIIHEGVITHIDNGGKLEQISELVSAMESRLDQIASQSPAALNRVNVSSGKLMLD